MSVRQSAVRRRLRTSAACCVLLVLLGLQAGRPAAAQAAEPQAFFTFAPQGVVVNQPVTFDASGSVEPDGGTIVSYKWDFGSGAFALATATETFTFLTTGQFLVRLQVTDDDLPTAETAIATRLITVHPTAPPLLSFAPVRNPRLLVGSPIEFDASATIDPDGSIARYEWDLDADGTFEYDSAGVPRASRTYFEFPADGQAAVRATVGLRVTDSSGVAVADWLTFVVYLFTNHADTIYGDALGNSIQGGAGADTLFGYDGADRLFGGRDGDLLYGGTGNDELAGASGHDRVYGAAGLDRLEGGYGDDILWGGRGNDELVGGGGADRLYGGVGRDVIVGRGGVDLLFGEAGNDILFARDGGRDVVRCGGGTDIVVADARDLLRQCEIVFGQAPEGVEQPEPLTNWTLRPKRR